MNKVESQEVDPSTFKNLAYNKAFKSMGKEPYSGIGAQITS